MGGQVITKEVIDGRPAVISYINDSLEPVNRDEATMIKIIFEDGEIRFGVKAPKDRLKSQWQSHKRRAMKLLEKHGDHDQSTHGNWADGGGGDEDDDKGGGGNSKFTTADGKSVPWKPSPSPHAKDKTSASSLLQLEQGITVADLEAKVPKSAEMSKVAEAKIAKMKADGAPDSQTEHKLPNGHYSPDRLPTHLGISRKLWSEQDMANALPPSGQPPTVYLIGGRGGSGKGWFTERGTLSKVNAVVANNDDVKGAFSEWEGWNAGYLHEEASDVGEQMEAMARDRGLNLVIDMTMKSKGSMEKRIKAFKAAGYKVSMHYMYASPATAAERALGRFVSGNEKNGKGRYVNPKYSLEESTTNEDTFDSFRDQADYWEVYDNMGKYPEPPKLHSRKGG